jgi:hypothetical protein
MKQLLHESSGYTSMRVVLLLALAMLCQSAALAGTPDHWCVGLGAFNGGSSIGAYPGSHDGWNGQQVEGQPPDWHFPDPGVYLRLYREQSGAWTGPTGMYGEVYASPIPAGGSKTWWDFYMWSHDYTPATPGQIAVGYGFIDEYGDDPPRGYTGHLVIDQVPAGVTWTGPMDYWFRMTTNDQTFLMPLAEVSNPLRGTRFHLTVYDHPIPEPSSAAAILAGLVGFGAVMRRRRRG